MLEEYRALYSLVLFRLSALDRRVPVIEATLTGLLAAMTSLPSDARTLALLAIPLAVSWLLRVTINHARSFEDALRRIEVLELQINQRVNFDAMCFQHRHPSRGHAVGGRTGHETIRSVWIAGLLMIGTCVFFFLELSWAPDWMRSTYVAYIGMVVLLMLERIRRWRAYRYAPGIIFTRLRA